MNHIFVSYPQVINIFVDNLRQPQFESRRWHNIKGPELWKVFPVLTPDLENLQFCYCHGISEGQGFHIAAAIRKLAVINIVLEMWNIYKKTLLTRCTWMNIIK